eukprot:766082-Hanusia_phi.AAC.5
MRGETTRGDRRGRAERGTDIGGGRGGGRGRGRGGGRGAWSKSFTCPSMDCQWTGSDHLHSRMMTARSPLAHDGAEADQDEVIQQRDFPCNRVSGSAAAQLEVRRLTCSFLLGVLGLVVGDGEIDRVTSDHVLDVDQEPQAGVHQHFIQQRPLLVALDLFCHGSYKLGLPLALHPQRGPPAVDDD